MLAILRSRTMNIASTLILVLCCLPLMVTAGNYTAYVCSNTTYNPNSTYQIALFQLLDSFSSTPPQSKYHNASIKASAGEQIESLYQCRGDFSLDICRSCVVNATRDVRHVCPNEKIAVIWYDECVLRFSNESIVSRIAVDPAVALINGRSVGETEQAEFSQDVALALNETVKGALSGSDWGFMTKETNTYKNFSGVDKIFTMVQCTGDLSKDDCGACLVMVTAVYPSFPVGRVGGQLLLPSCFYHFEVYKFYNVSGVPLSPASAPLMAPASAPLMAPAMQPLLPVVPSTEGPSRAPAKQPSQPVVSSTKGPSLAPASSGQWWKGNANLVATLTLFTFIAAA